MSHQNACDALKEQGEWTDVCDYSDLLLNAGVGVRLGHYQLALFLLPPAAPGGAERLFAVDNHDPFSGANVIARGIVGDTSGEPVVASPLYKQHFRLNDGVCLENAEQRLRCWPVRRNGERIELKV